MKISLFSIWKNEQNYGFKILSIQNRCFFYFRKDKTLGININYVFLFSYVK